MRIPASRLDRGETCHVDERGSACGAVSLAASSSLPGELELFEGVRCAEMVIPEAESNDKQVEEIEELLNGVRWNRHPKKFR
jgi:hypothetical protein